jgi:hypothetical protein
MNDDTLILYYYNDGLTDRERRQVESAINTDARVAEQYEALCRQLDDMDEPDVQAVPPHTLQRWHDSIDRAAQQGRISQQKPSKPFNLFSIAWGAAVTAALAIGIGIGMYFSGGATSTSIPVVEVANLDPSGNTAVPVAFTRGVIMYLQDTKQELAAMPVDTVADRTMLILQIIEQNRLFERAAEQNNSQSLARVLRAFEPILMRLAADDIAPQDAEALRAQLAFELNVMLTKLSRNTSNETVST